MPKKQAMSKRELKGLIAAKLRDPATPAYHFIALLKRLENLSAKHKKSNTTKQSRPAKDKVHPPWLEEVLRREQQAASTPKRPEVTSALPGITQADCAAYLASGQIGMPEHALKEQMEAEWKAELEARRTTPANRADVNE